MNEGAAGERPVRIIAGAAWPDRLALPRPGPDSRWFEPRHIRSPGVVREAIAEQVHAGADVVLAPAWLTHRRALMEVGESRRAAEWTSAAVRVAREGVEEGLTRREGEVMPVLVAGPLPDLESGGEPGDGRLATRDVAAERDLRTAVALLADAGADLLVLEPRGGEDAARRAVAAAAETGLDVWATWSPASGPFDAWTAAVAEAGASTLLVDPAGVAVAGGSATDWGVVLPADQTQLAVETVRGWLDTGATVLGLVEAATAEALAPFVEARAAFTGAVVEERAAAEEAWGAWVDQAAGAAPGGEALWLVGAEGAGGPGAVMPAGFRWTVARDAELSRLPEGRFRLVVAGTPSVPLAALARLLDDGGILLARGLDVAALVDGIRILDRGTGPGAELLARREA